MKRILSFALAALALEIATVTVLSQSIARAEQASDIPLLQAVAHNDTALVKHLIAKGASTEARDRTGNTALMIAAGCGYFEMARLLVEAGAQVNARGYLSNTALIYAARDGHTEIVELLIEEGAQVHAQNEYGNSALGLAEGWGHREIVEILKGQPEWSQPRSLLAGLF
jgi:ankyrin repeat protein